MEAVGAYGSDSEAEGQVNPSPSAARDTIPALAAAAVIEKVDVLPREEAGLMSVRDIRGTIGRDFNNPLFVQRHLHELGIDEHGTNLRAPSN